MQISPERSGAIPDPDHPEGDHVQRVVERTKPHLEQAVRRGVQVHGRLGFANDEAVPERVLADATALGPGEQAGLKRRHPEVAVDVRRPGFLVGLDAEAQAPAAHLVAGSRRASGAPVRQVVGQPQAPVELRRLERVLDLELVPRPVEAATRHRRPASRS